MNNLKITIVTLFAFITIATACCKKPTPAPNPNYDKFGLPIPTQSGKQFIACLIDGQPMIVEGKISNSFLSNGLGCNHGWYEQNILTMTCKSGSPKLTLHITAKINNDNSIPGIANYNYGGIKTNLSIGNTLPTLPGYYEAKPDLPATINIAYNDGNILSGTFDILLANDSGKQVHLTEGRFDMTLL